MQQLSTNYSPTGVDGQVNITMSESVTVTFELSAAEENLFINNGVTIITILTNMLFNDNANLATDDIIAYYYDNYFTENSPYLILTPENPMINNGAIALVNESTDHFEETFFCNHKTRHSFKSKTK